MTRKIAYLGLFSTLAIILGYLESLIPLFPGIPGIKIGLANLCVLFILVRYSWREAALVSAVRILVIGFLFGNLFGILYSLAGAAFSLTIMTLLRRTDFSLLGISVAGGVAHNIAQIVIAIFLLHTFALIYYLPVLLISGTAAGLFIGFLTTQLHARLPR